MTREKAYALRAMIEKASASLDDEDALEAIELFPNWTSDKHYTVGVRVRFEGTLYSCLQEHDSQESWTPAAAPSLWAKVLIPEPEVIPEWEQPDSTNPYKIGDKVRHNGLIWVSTVDGNVWEPGAYGWEVVSE